MSGVLLAGLSLRLLPTFPLALLLRRLIVAFYRLHPRVGDRLSGYAGRRLCLDPTDLPLCFVLTLTRDSPQLAVVAQGQTRNSPGDAVVRATLRDLTSLLEGRSDGDALFFSRRLQISGDTELVLALRNALDDARIDLRHLLSQALGPFGGPALKAALNGHAKLDRILQMLAQAATAELRDRLERQGDEIARLRRDLEDLPHRGRARQGAVRRKAEA